MTGAGPASAQWRKRRVSERDESTPGMVLKSQMDTDEDLAARQNASDVPSLSPATVLIVNGVQAAFNSSVRAPAVSEGSALMQ